MFREKLDLFKEFLGENKWFVGDYISFPDFHIYEILEIYEDVIPGIIAEYPTLKAFWQRFNDIPEIKGYIGSDRFLAAPINNKMAIWGNK